MRRNIKAQRHPCQSVSGSAPTGREFAITNTRPTGRETHGLRRNKVGVTNIPTYDCGVNAISQRKNAATSGTAFPGAATITRYTYAVIRRLLIRDLQTGTAWEAKETLKLNRMKFIRTITRLGLFTVMGSVASFGATEQNDEVKKGIQFHEGLVKELSGFKIEEFIVSETNLSAALEEAFSKAAGTLTYLKGYRLDPGYADRKITLSLRDVEFGVLLIGIANQAKLRIVDENGIIHFAAIQSSEPSVVVLPVKKQTAQNLGFYGDSKAKEVLQNLGLEVQGAYFSTASNQIVLKAYEEDIEIFRSLLALSERGYRIRVDRRRTP